MVLHKTADGTVGCDDWDDLCTTFLGEGRNRYPYSYVVFTDGTDTFAQNGATGAIDFGGPADNGTTDGGDAAAVIQAAIDAVNVASLPATTAAGGTVFVRAGVYSITTTISMKSFVDLIGEANYYGPLFNVNVGIAGAPATDSGIYVPASATDCHIANIRMLETSIGAFTNATYGIYADTLSSFIHVVDCIIRYFEYGIYGLQVAGMKIIRPVIYTFNSQAIILYGCHSDSMVEGGSIGNQIPSGEAYSGTCVYLQNCKEVMVRDVGTFSGHYGVQVDNCTDTKLVRVYAHVNYYSGIWLRKGATRTLIDGCESHCNNQLNDATASGIMVGEPGEAAVTNTIIINSDCSSIAGKFGVPYVNNQQVYGINVTAVGTDTHIRSCNFITNATRPIQDDKVNTDLPAIRGEFVNYGGGSAGWVAPVINTSPGGIDIDADDEFAHTRRPLGAEIQQVVRIKIWAYTNILEADKMRLRIVAHGATDNEPWSGNAIDVPNHPSESSNFAAGDVVYWLIDVTDDAQIGTLATQDYVELLAAGEVAGGADCATDALFGGVEIEYV